MSETYRRPDIRLDQQMALRTAATWLVDEFGAMFGVETIERFLHSSYEQFAENGMSFGFEVEAIGIAEADVRARIQKVAAGCP